MRTSKLCSLLLCVLMLLPMVACKPEPQEQQIPTQSTEQTTQPEEITTDPGEIEPDPPKDAIETKKQELEAIRQAVGAPTETVLYAKDFGAVGDGKTDDGAAIFNAVTEAIKQKATLKFEQDKKYYISQVPGNRQTPFAINGADGLTVDGCGSTFLVTPGMIYFEVENSKNVKFVNCHFDFAVPVYLVGKVKSVEGTKVVFDVDMNPYTSHFNFTASNGFSILYNEGTQKRPHTFMTEMQRTGDKEVTITYKGHVYKEGQTVFLPNPGVAHVGNAVCWLKGNTGALLFENVGIHAAPVFCWNISKNSGKVFFENVDLVPAPDNTREIQMVAWRDGFHCKDNTGSLHWNNCESGVLHDDIFNIANTLGEVVASENDNTFTVKSHQTAGQVFACSPGDTIDVYEVKTGYYMGCGRVRSVKINADGTRTLTLYYGQTIDKVKEGCIVANRDTGAPGSTITNCHFQGTFRFMRNLYVENTVFDMLQTWIMVSGNVEGPMPGNMDFVGCTFNGGNIQIDAMNYNTAKRMKKIGEKITDIGYWGCTFNQSSVSTSTLANYTISDTYTTEELYTVKNDALYNDPITISPTDAEVKDGVTWDWSLFTMPMTGDIAELCPTASVDPNTQNTQSVGTGVLAIHAAAGKKLYFDGLSAAAIPGLYKKGNSHLIKLTYFAPAPVEAKLVIGGKVVSDNLFNKVGEWTTVSLIHNAASDAKIAYIECIGDGDVYLGELTLAAFINADPSQTQLESGHTFVWDGNVTIGNSTAINLADVTNASAKKAMLENADNFGKTVLHVTDTWGDFSGLRKKAYYTAGTNYRISIDAYIASPLPAGCTVDLVVLDASGKARTLKENVFSGEGLCHAELDWKVSPSGENKLAFSFKGTSAEGTDVYVGNFTITQMPPLSPYQKYTVTEFTYPTVEQLEQGYTFDFSKGVFFDMGKQNYVEVSALNAYAAQTLRDAGFGDYAYYYNETFDGLGLGETLKKRPGRPITITMVVYDCQGNLPTAPLGALTLLNMSGGLQNSAGCDYVLTPDPTVPGLYTMTFAATPPAGTDALRFYVLEPCEFYIASVTVDVQ